MNRFHRRAALIRTRFYVVGFVFWLVVFGLIALGGSVTDQPTEGVSQSSVKDGGHRGN